MRFLVITTSREAMQPEFILPSIQRMQKWVAELRASGKLVDTFAFAGTIGGGGIIEVESHEELDAIMARFPFAGVSNVEVHALSDLDASLDAAEENITEVMAMMQAAQR